MVVWIAGYLRKQVLIGRWLVPVGFTNSCIWWSNLVASARSEETAISLALYLGLQVSYAFFLRLLACLLLRNTTICWLSITIWKSILTTRTINFYQHALLAFRAIRKLCLVQTLCLKVKYRLFVIQASFFFRYSIEIILLAQWMLLSHITIQTLLEEHDLLTYGRLLLLVFPKNLLLRTP